MLWLYIKTVTNGVLFTSIPIIKESGNRHRNVVLQPKENNDKGGRTDQCSAGMLG